MGFHSRRPHYTNALHKRITQTHSWGRVRVGRPTAAILITQTHYTNAFGGPGPRSAPTAAVLITQTHFTNGFGGPGPGRAAASAGPITQTHYSNAFHKRIRGLGPPSHIRMTRSSPTFQTHIRATQIRSGPTLAQCIPQPQATDGSCKLTPQCNMPKRA